MTTIRTLILTIALTCTVGPTQLNGLPPSSMLHNPSPMNGSFQNVLQPNFEYLGRHIQQFDTTNLNAILGMDCDTTNAPGQSPTEANCFDPLYFYPPQTRQSRHTVSQPGSPDMDFSTSNHTGSYLPIPSYQSANRPLPSELNSANLANAQEVYRAQSNSSPTEESELSSTNRTICDLENEVPHEAVLSNPNAMEVEPSQTPTASSSKKRTNPDGTSDTTPCSSPKRPKASGS